MDCALSYGALNLINGTLLNAQDSNIGISPLPGSSLIFDRKTKAFVKCTSDLCPYAKFENSLGLINMAPTLGAASIVFGISPFAQKRVQMAALKFLLFATQDSFDDAVPSGNMPETFVHPYRKSHFNLTSWIDRGFTEDFASEAIHSLLSVDSQNTNISPVVGNFHELTRQLDSLLSSFLSSVTLSNITVAQQYALATDFTETIDLFLDNEYIGGRSVFFDDVKRSFGVYTEYDEKYYSTYIHGLGLSFFCIICITSAFIGYCVCKKKKSDIVFNSFDTKVIFMVCLGALMIAGAIVAQSFNDSWVPENICDISCSLSLIGGIGGQSIILCAYIGRSINKLELLRDTDRSLNISIKDILKASMLSTVPAAIYLCYHFSYYDVEWIRSFISEDEDDTSTALEIWGYCTHSGTSSTDIKYIYLVFICDTLLALCALVNCEHDDPERLFIMLTLFMYLQVQGIGLPLTLFVENNPEIFSLTMLLVYFLVSFVPLFLLLVPLTLVRSDLESLLVNKKRLMDERLKLKSTLKNSKNCNKKLKRKSSIASST